MAISLIGSVIDGNSNPSGSQSIAVPSGTQKGDLRIMAAGARYTDTGGDGGHVDSLVPADWTRIGSQSFSNGGGGGDAFTYVDLFWRISPASESAALWEARDLGFLTATGYVSCTFRGATGPETALGAQSVADDTNSLILSGLTIPGYGLLIAIYNTSDANTGWTPPSGMTEVGEAGFNTPVSLAYQVGHAIGATGTKTATHTVSTGDLLGFMAFMPAIVGGGWGAIPIGG